MSDMEELARRLVVRRKSDGRCVYDEQAKAELVAICKQPGTSVSRLAREVGVNANQLSRWVRERGPRRALAVPVSSAFVPVPIAPPQRATSASHPSLQARLPNGVVLELQGCDAAQFGPLIDSLGRLRCFASTKG